MTTQTEHDVSLVRTITKAVAGVGLASILLIGGCMAGKPRYNLYRANTEKQAVIKESEARSKAAEFEALSAVTQARARADAQVIEAGGVAEANRIIAESITPSYVDYLFVTNLGTTANQVIYVPTEAGMPILEADRLALPVGGE